MNPVLYLETPVLTAALFAVVGFWFRVQYQSDKERDRAMAAQSRALAVVVEAIKPIREWQDKADTRLMAHDTRIATLSESTAVLAATLESHLNWHDAQTRHRVQVHGTVSG